MKKNVKNIFKVILVFTIFFYNQSYINAENNNNEENYIIGKYGSYETAQSIIKNVMTTYYLRGSYYQYNYPKTFYFEDTPENATSQDVSYSVCAAFAGDVYKEAFGVNTDNTNNLPIYPQIVGQNATAARNYYKQYLNGTQENDGHFLLYYNQKTETSSGDIQDDEIDLEDTDLDSENDLLDANNLPFVYRKNNNNNLSDYEELISNLRPGDIVGYSSHVLMVYDLLKDENGKVVDVLLLNSTIKPFVRTRLSGTNRIGYIRQKSKYSNDYLRSLNYNFSIDTIDVPYEGTLKRNLLSKNNYLVKQVDGKNELTCKDMDECFIIRPFYDDDGEAVFNYPISINAYNRSELRTEYPGLFIEKTVNVGDNNSVNIGDELEYKIIIRNDGYKNYDKGFYIKEQVSDYVQYIQDQSDADGNYHTWRIDKHLEQGESIEIKYKVKIIESVDNINKIVQETGKFFDENENNYISTGMIKNTIIPKVSEPIQDYQTCYNQLYDSYSGLELIDQIYNCARGTNTFGENFSFSDFKFDLNEDEEETEELLQKRLFVTNNKSIKKYGRTASNALILNSNPDENHRKFIDMILNNYWGGIRMYDIENENIKYKINYDGITISNEKYTIPNWSGDASSKRARNIYKGDFKDGDVLIYNFMPLYWDGSINREPNLTREQGMYAYIYINGKFVGHNIEKNKTCSARDEYTYHYYDMYTDEDNDGIVDDYDTLGRCYNKPISTGNILDTKRFLIDPTGGLDYLYNQLDTGEITQEEYEDFLEYVNYQSLFGKDNYVILRPEKIIKEVDNILVSKLPNKTSYRVNEEISLSGGEITVSYNDGTTKVISLENNLVSISGYNKSEIGEQTITVTYEGKQTTYKVMVNGTFSVTFYDSDGTTVLKATTQYESGTAASEIEKPTEEKDGYVLVDWYTSLEYTEQYHFTGTIDSNLNLYAKWEEINVSITTDVTSVNYGTVYTNFSNYIRRNVVITNNGNVAVSIDVKNPTNSGPFSSIGFSTGTVLNPGESYTAVVAANPNGTNHSTPGTYNGTYQFGATYVNNNNKKATANVEATITIQKRPQAIAYRTHVQSYGWQSYVRNGVMSGTQGEAKRLEAIQIKLENQDYTGNIEYRTHIQKNGWEKSFKKNNEMSGTSGEAKRLEAIEIRLTGEMSEHYDVYYRVHAQSFGWLGWARNGESSGTAGYAKRLEGIEIKLVEKDSPFEEYGQKEAFVEKKVLYTTHVQSYGWQEYTYDGNMSGTQGEAKRLEGIKIMLNNQKYSGNIEYQTHIQSYGWETTWKKNNEMSGTSGKAKRLEAIRIRLTGEMANHYDIYYRVHAQSFGWMSWAKNGESSGTAGYAKRLEGIEIVLVNKGEAPPVRTNTMTQQSFVNANA